MSFRLGKERNVLWDAEFCDLEERPIVKRYSQISLSTPSLLSRTSSLQSSIGDTELDPQEQDEEAYVNEITTHEMPFKKKLHRPLIDSRGSFPSGSSSRRSSDVDIVTFILLFSVESARKLAPARFRSESSKWQYYCRCLLEQAPPSGSSSSSLDYPIPHTDLLADDILHIILSYLPTFNYTVGDTLLLIRDQIDFSPHWALVRIVYIDEESSKVTVHFNGWNKQHDETVPMDSHRISIWKPPLKEPFNSL